MVRREIGDSASLVASKAIDWLDAWTRNMTRPFLLHVHFKETHEPWHFPAQYFDASAAGLDRRLDYGAPEPPTLCDVSVAGPIGCLPIEDTKRLEVLAKRMVHFNSSSVDPYGRAPLSESRYSKLAAESNACPLRKLAHQKLVGNNFTRYIGYI